MLSANELLAQLPYFTGTESWYRNSLFPRYLYTDGVKFIADEAGAYWLIDKVFANQLIGAVGEQPFQTWKLMVSDTVGTLVCEDGNGNVVYTEKIEYTDFPLPEIKMFFTDNTLLLTSEY